MGKNPSGKIITPFFRVSYPNVFKSRYNELNGKDEYSLVMLFDKKTAAKDLTAMKTLANKLAKEMWPNGLPAKLKSPFRDGDLEKPDNPSFAGMIFVTAKSTYLPGLVDAKNQPIMSQDEFYGGCYARAEVNLYAYDVKGNKGIAVGLNHIQKWKDGQPFGNRSSAEDAFSPVEDSGGEEESLAGQGSEHNPFA